MNKITLENLNITVKTLTVDGKKLTKSFLQQLPIELSVYHYCGEHREIGCPKNEDDGYCVDGNLLCWFNITPTSSFSPYLTANKWKGVQGYPNKDSIFYDGDLFFALFLNPDEELRLTIINKSAIERLNLELVFI